MKILYFECSMGAAGDMLAASLFELLPPQAQSTFIEKMNALNLPGVTVRAERTAKCGIAGTHMSVRIDGVEEAEPDAAHDHAHHDGEHEHAHHEGEHDHAHHDDEHEHAHHHGSSLHDIEHILKQLPLPERVRRDALSVYGLLASAESHAHGKPVDQIHFHEVGTLDALADIVGVCLLINELAPGRVLASPVHVGSGTIRCAHGILPVPAPATAYLLQGVPTYGGAVLGELCTPTGAALLKYFCEDFGERPVMRISGVGYGMGTKDFEAVNCVRAMLGETDDGRDEVVELKCNLDDMTPEAVGFAQERLFDAGALDVYTIAAGMKKNRPGVLLSCLCRKEDAERMARLIFRHTSSLGVREYACRRYTLDRSERTADTRYGPVRVKESSGWGVRRKKIEYEDAARIARERDVPLAEVLRSAREEPAQRAETPNEPNAD